MDVQVTRPNVRTRRAHDHIRLYYIIPIARRITDQAEFKLSLTRRRGRKIAKILFDFISVRCGS